MAKKDKTPKEAPVEAKTEKAEKTPEFKFGVSDLAELLDSEPSAVRVKLRNAKIEKAGKSYGWNTKADLKEVADQLKAAASKEAKKEAKADKPAKASKKDAEPEPAAEPEKKSKKDKKKK